MSENFDFDAWLAGATVAEVAVDVFQDGSLLGRVAEWQRRMDRVKDEPVGELSAGDESPKTVLEAEGRELLAQLQASKTVWYLGALTSADEIAVGAAHPLPADPRKAWTVPVPEPIKNWTEKQAEAFIVAFMGWTQRKEEFEELQGTSPEYQKYLVEVKEALVSRGAEKIRRSFKRIEQNGKILTDKAPSVEQIKKLADSIGEIQVGKLLDAVTAATEIEPEVPADFLSLTSTSDQD